MVAHATTQVRAHSNHVSPVSPEKAAQSNESSPSLDDTVWRSFVNGENLGVNQRPLSCHFPLQLPDLIAAPEESSDFNSNTPGVSLKRAVVVTREGPDDRLFGLNIRKGVRRGHPVLLVEGSDFVPGDQLVSVNGAHIVDHDKDAVVKILSEMKENKVELMVRKLCLNNDNLESGNILVPKKEDN